MNTKVKYQFMPIKIASILNHGNIHVQIRLMKLEALGFATPNVYSL
jgi:hypothetical protein